MNIGERIAQLRKSRSMSQFQLAKMLNIATSTLGMYETNKRKPNMEMLEKLADFFGVSVDFLLGRPEKDDLKTADLADDDTIFTYKGQPLSDDDKEIIRRLMNGK